MAFKKAVREQVKLRMAIDGPTKAGKSYTSLAVGTELAKLLGGRLAAIDSEAGRLLLYADEFDFDHDGIEVYSPDNYARKITEAVATGAKVILIDGITQAWSGQGGVLEIVDQATDAAAARSGRGANKFTSGWSKGTPAQNDLIQAMIHCKTHLIVTMRSKMEYVLETKNGVQVPTKVGLAPIQREETPYEFDFLMDMDLRNFGTISGTRASKQFPTGRIFELPGKQLAQELYDWLMKGKEPSPEPASAPIPASEAKGQAPQAKAQETPKNSPSVDSPREKPLDPELLNHLRGLLLTSPGLGSLYVRGTLDERARQVGRDIKQYFAVKSKAELMAVQAHQLMSALTSEASDDPPEERGED